MNTEFVINAEFQLNTENGEEFFIGFSVLFQHGLQFACNFLVDGLGDDFQLVVMLEHFTGDVQRKVGAVHQPFDKAVIIGKEIGAFIHDQNAVGVKLEAFFVIFGIKIIRRFAGNIEKSVISGQPFGFAVDHLQRFGVIVEFILIELLIFFFGDLAFVFAPERNHAVQSFGFDHRFGFAIFAAFHGTMMSHIHADGVTDIIGIFLYEIFHAEGGEIITVFFFFGIFFKIQCNFGPGVFLFTGFDGITVGAFGSPAVSGIGAESLAFHHDFVADHKGGIEAHAKLADDFDIFRFGIFLFKGLRTALGDGAEIVFQFIGGHADAVIGNLKDAVAFVEIDADLKIIFVQTDGFIGKRTEIELINGVGSVGDQLTEKNFLMGIDRIDHQIQ